MALPVRGREQYSYEATYFGGHSAFPKQMKVHLTLFSDCVEIPEFPARIPYSRIKKVQSVTKEELSTMRLMFLGLLAFAWKKKKLYMLLTYIDGAGIEQNPIFDVEKIEEIQPAIYQMMTQSRPSPTAPAPSISSPPPAPSPRVAPVPPPPPPARSSKTCPVCGAKCSWIEQYSRWYCLNCREYR